MTRDLEQIQSFILLGTVHRDPKGYIKLSRFLERERPVLITVEISPYSRSFRVKNSAGLRDQLRKNLCRIHQEEGRPLKDMIGHSAIQGIFLLLQVPYEWRAAKDYASRHKALVRGIDLSLYSRDKLGHLAELIAIENLRTLLRTPCEDFSRRIESTYSQARFFFSYSPSFRPEIQEVKVREAHMAQEIYNSFKQAKGEKLLHIGGWEHLVEFSNGKSLFGLLRDLYPKRALLPAIEN